MGEVSGWKREFPLSPNVFFDVATSDMFGMPIGFKSSYPVDLKERVVAAAMSYHLQVGVDYCKRKHVSPPEKRTAADTSPDTFNAQFTATCLDSVRRKLDDVEANSSDNAKVGLVVADLTFLRCHYSLQNAFELANRGALFESLSVGRTILEQLAWAHSIASESDEILISRTKAQKSIAQLKEVSPAVGDLYGYLSEHCHWTFESHVPIITSKSGKAAAMLASVNFKVEAIVALSVLSSVFIRTLDATHAISDFQTDFDAVELIEQVLKLANEQDMAQSELTLRRLLKIAKES